MRNEYGSGYKINTMFIGTLLCLILCSVCPAVSSKVTRHKDSKDLIKGKTDGVVIDSRGTIQLGRAAQELIGSESFEDVWSINCIVVSGGTVYFGTSPNGGIYKYELDKVTKIYSLEAARVNPANEDKPKSDDEEDDAVDPNSEAAESESPVGLNEHIFAMATDVSGRLLAGISGDKCRLCRLEGKRMETIFEPNEAKYIFAITVAESGDIYLGTGPEGGVYRLNSLGKKPQLIYDSPDKNILSISVGPGGLVYAGSDTRGLVYAINPRNRKVKVLYDSDQPEITALLVADSMKTLNAKRSTPKTGCLYAAATSAEMIKDQKQFAASVTSGSFAGRPERGGRNKTSSDSNGNGRKLQIANTSTPANGKPPQGPPPASKRAKPAKASYVYQITADGFVNEVFVETAVFFCLARQEDKLLVGTGNNAQLFSVDPAIERQAVVYEDKQSSQITALAVVGQDVCLGMANPAKLIKLTGGFASEGTYISDLIDAGQPANWGKLQLEADVPEGCSVMVASRSGNVKDVNDPTFSQWSEPMEVTGPIQLSCPLGRFCQYKLILKSNGGPEGESPLIREIAVASTVPNLAPKVESVNIAPIAAAGKQGHFKISYGTKDDNDDKLVYKIDFRKLGRTNWIELKDQHEAGDFEWNGKSVEDGRYEIRVIASDARSNTTSTALTGSRISEPVVVDNTGPVVTDVTLRSNRENSRSYKIFEIEITDVLSAIGTLEYTIDSNEDWMGTVPNDLVYDTTDENFTIKIDMEDLNPGDHILTIKVSDSVGNTTYRTVDFVRD